MAKMIDLYPAILPADYLPDVRNRAFQYRRIAWAADKEELPELKLEKIDHIGLLPQQAQTLFDITGLKPPVQPQGIRKIDAGEEGGRIYFVESMKTNPAHLIHLIQTHPKQCKLEGSDKLRFFADLEDPKLRGEETRKVIEVLADV